MRTIAFLIPVAMTLVLSAPALCEEASPAKESPAAQAPVVSTSEEPSRGDITFDIHSNLAGLAQWGLTLSAEVGTSITGLVRVRSLNMGLISKNAVHMESDNELIWGIGAAAGGRFYRNSSCQARGFFVGLWAEYLHVVGERMAYDWRLGFLVPQVEIGYRWIRGRVIIGVGGSIGAMFEVLHSREYVHATKEVADGSYRNLFLETFLEIGFLF